MGADRGAISMDGSDASETAEGSSKAPRFSGAPGSSEEPVAPGTGEFIQSGGASSPGRSTSPARSSAPSLAPGRGGEATSAGGWRSEERRVGKERRAPWLRARQP